MSPLGVRKRVPLVYKHRAGKRFALHEAAGGLRTSSLPGELLEAMDAEAVTTLSLDRLPQHLETLLTFVFVLHGHRQHTEGNPRQRWGAVHWNPSHSSPSICCEFLSRRIMDVNNKPGLLRHQSLCGSKKLEDIQSKSETPPLWRVLYKGGTLYWLQQRVQNSNSSFLSSSFVVIR